MGEAIIKKQYAHVHLHIARARYTAETCPGRAGDIAERMLLQAGARNNNTRRPVAVSKNSWKLWRRASIWGTCIHWPCAFLWRGDVR